jgi:hypothetical protein
MQAPGDLVLDNRTAGQRVQPWIGSSCQRGLTGLGEHIDRLGGEGALARLGAQMTILNKRDDIRN